MKYNNICIVGIPEGEESEQGIENLIEEIMTKNFPNLVKEEDTQITLWLAQSHKHGELK